jgi:hypothetical protein
VPDRTPGALVSASDDDPYIPPPAPPQLKPSAPRPVIHGFKVHPVAKKAKANQGARAKKAAKKRVHSTER